MRFVISLLATVAVLAGCEEAQEPAAAERQTIFLVREQQHEVTTTDEDIEVILGVLDNLESAAVFNSRFIVSLSGDLSHRVNKLEILNLPRTDAELRAGNYPKIALEISLAGLDGERTAELTSTLPTGAASGSFDLSMAKDFMSWSLKNNKRWNSYECSYDPEDVDDNWFFVLVSRIPGRPESHFLLYCVKTESGVKFSTENWPTDLD